MSVCLSPSSGLDQLLEMLARQMLVGLIRPGAWYQVVAHQAGPAQNWAGAHQAGPAWMLALAGCPLCSGLDQPSEHPASLASSSCAHTGSHPLSAGAVSSRLWQAASRHHDFLLNNTSLKGLVYPLNCIIITAIGLGSWVLLKLCKTFWGRPGFGQVRVGKVFI